MPGLFSTLRMKGLTFGGRIVMPPMANNMAPPDGSVTDQHVAHYTARAGRDVALIMVEHSYVRPDGRAGDKQLGIYDDALIPGLRRLAGGIKEAGSLAGIQITHSGSRTTRAVIGRRPRGPSDVMAPGDTEVPEPFPVEELPEIVRAFGEAARRAAEAGFDLIEIHGAHGYLLNQFLSPYTNRRDDDYGGNSSNRLRLALQVVREVRRRVGPDFVLWYRLGSDDMLEGGLHLANAQWAAPRLVEAGIDAIDVSGGLMGSRPPHLQGQVGYFVPLAEGIKAVTRVPVCVAGGITNPEYADQLIREGRTDLVGIGRALLADPAWARKAREVVDRG